MTNLATVLAAAAFGAAALTSATAHADAKLTATVFTASPGGFLVDSTLIAGDKEAILIDAQFDLADAHRLVAMILESKKQLTTVYITHAHPDHYFGLTVIHDGLLVTRQLRVPGASVDRNRVAFGELSRM